MPAAPGTGRFGSTSWPISGDGFDPTYAIAYLVAADKLYGKRTGEGRHRRHQGATRRPGAAARTAGARLGGDQVYPWPTREAYDQHTFKPYELALPEPPAGRRRRLPPASRHVFAIPGNHDWYDGLNAFDDQFCRSRAARYLRQGRRFGDLQTCQHRSSFAIKLPHNWWIWGADIQLNDTARLRPARLLHGGRRAAWRRATSSCS